MSAHELTTHDIDRMAAAATEEVMEKLYLIVRQAVTRKVGEELADQHYQLDLERERIGRMEQAKAHPRTPPKDLVAAVAKVATLWVTLENDQYSRAEHQTRARLETAVAELTTEYRRYAAITRREGL